jgi:hypothetical protein
MSELDDTRTALAEAQAVLLAGRSAEGRREDQDSVIKALGLTGPDARIRAANAIACVDELRQRRADRMLTAPVSSTQGGSE